MVDDTTGPDEVRTDGESTLDIVISSSQSGDDGVGQTLLRQDGTKQINLEDEIAALGVVWEEGSPGFGIVKLRAQSPAGEPMGAEITVGSPGCNNHSPSASGHNSSAAGTNVAWVESLEGDTSGVGRIMVQAYSLTVGKAANDNPDWVADMSGVGVLGCEPAVASLDGGDTLVTWIGTDGNAHGRLYPPGAAAAGPAAGDGVDAAEYAAVNAALADLGPVVAAADGGRRLHITEPRPGSFAVMWLALAENSFVLRGSLFVTPADTRSDDAPGGRWTESPLADIRLPQGFTGEFSLSGMGDNSADVIVSYAELGAGASSVQVLARRIDGPDTDGRIGQSSSEIRVGTPPATDDTARAVTSAVDQSDSPSGDTPLADTYVQQTGDNGDLLAGLFRFAADVGINQTAPIVEAIQDGFIVAWETPGASEGIVTIKMARFDTHGAARSVPGGGTVIDVTDNAVATVSASITGVGRGAAVAYVDAGEGSLVVKVYDDVGAQIGAEVVVDTGGSGAISEIAIGSQESENAEFVDQLAVVYVRDNGDADGGNSDYGNIMLQRYGLPTADGEPQQLIALGRDGHHDGADAAVQLTTEGDGSTATNEAAVGRAPDIAGLDGGELAVIWVANDGTRETIEGCVIEADGEQVLRIDLTSLIEDAGLAKGTKPTLSSSGDGDILVSWLQPHGNDGGYVMMAALYRAAGAGAWIEPEQAIELKEFDSEPEDFSVTVSEDHGLFIDVTWRSDSSGSGGGDRILSQRYDLDGNDLGGAKMVAANALADEQQNPSNLSAAGLLDGQIVVVYTEQKSNGDVDVAAHIVDTHSLDEPDSHGTLLGDNGSDASAGDAEAGSLTSETTFSTGVDQEIAINVLADNADPGLTVSHINGACITTATPVDVGSGWVQLREDGLLTFNPDAGYSGRITFDYTVTGADARAYGSHATVSVEADETPATPATPDTAPAKRDDALFGDAANDFFVFAPGFGFPSDQPGGPNDPQEVIDVSSSGYATFQQLLDSGALVQDGADVVITFNPADPVNSDKVTLRGIDLSVLSGSDFKF